MFSIFLKGIVAGSLILGTLPGLMRLASLQDRETAQVAARDGQSLCGL